MIVVTGAAGFIGSNIVAALNARGRSDVVAADFFRAPEPDRPLPRRPAYLDVMQVRQRVDARELAAWLADSGQDVQAIIHMGACSDTTQSDRAFERVGVYTSTVAFKLASRDAPSKEVPTSTASRALPNSS